MDRKEYLSERHTLIQLEMEAYRSFDKTILAISSGSIALSVSMIDRFQHAALWCLPIASWSFWLLSILFQIISYWATSKAMQEEQIILGEQYKDDSVDPRENQYRGIPTQYNLAALIALVMGMLLFLAFIAINLHNIIR